MSLEKELQKYNVTDRYPVQWGEMDAANHVNNTVYLRWAESSRILYFSKMGMDLSFDEGVGPIMGWVDCKYIYPITFPDNVIIGVRAVEILEDRFFLETSLFSEKYNRIAALSKQSVIPYDYGNLKKAKMPTEWVEKIREIEGKEV